MSLNHSLPGVNFIGDYIGFRVSGLGSKLRKGGFYTIGDYMG